MPLTLHEVTLHSPDKNLKSGFNPAPVAEADVVHLYFKYPHISQPFKISDPAAQHTFSTGERLLVRFSKNGVREDFNILVLEDVRFGGQDIVLEGKIDTWKRNGFAGDSSSL